ncbi:hypothetical protein [Paenibacillus thermotolerans]|uniref:hypothetical protein n=1 Tax=Paenibacillus thermotolerans TaxID=3027807 RepID=UPI00236752FC|nr:MULTISPECIES: hypothetical protein [unclassified Paenibacillus]
MVVSPQQACVIFNKLNVNLVEDGSGIFIGANQAIGWSSIGKTNEGFGSLTNASLSRSVNVVYDSDVIDTKIDDLRHIQLMEQPMAQQCAVDFESVNANAVLSGSAIDIGDNKQPGWNNSRKTNYGNGKGIGRNRYTQIANIVFDDDLVDAPFEFEGDIVHSGSADKNIRIRSQRQSPET